MGILTVEMQHLVRTQRLCYAATVCPDGTPNLSPKGTITVWDDYHLVFADIASPGTVENLQQNPAIEINIVDPFARKGYRFKGTAVVLTTGDVFAAMRAFSQEQGVISPIHGAVLITVTRAAPLISPAYDGGATEAEIRDRWEAYYEAANNAARTEGKTDG